MEQNKIEKSYGKRSNINRKHNITCEEINKISINRSSRCDAAETNPTRNHEVVCLIPGFSQWVKDLALP